MEVLEHWKAPLAGLDPWRPESFTARAAGAAGEMDASARSPAKRRRSTSPRSNWPRPGGRSSGCSHADEAEADAIRQRLAGLGAALLPEVYARLKDAAADQDRRRLLILRYRLAAPDSLVLRWPGGLERLGDADPRQRRKAAEELAKLAGGEDKPLLLGAVRRPRSPGARDQPPRPATHRRQGRPTPPLVKLLADPEPNVRAAVLKQLEETPDAAMVPAVVKYLKTGKGPRPGRPRHPLPAGGQGKRSPPVPHVAAEARELAGAGGGGGRHRQARDEAHIGDGDSRPTTQLQVAAYVALLDLLDDEDAFVVAKAVEGLSNADLAVAVEPLVKAAEKHPELAANVLQMLAGAQQHAAEGDPLFAEILQARAAAGAGGGDCRALDRRARRRGRGTAADAGRQGERGPHCRGVLASAFVGCDAAACQRQDCPRKFRRHRVRRGRCRQACPQSEPAVVGGAVSRRHHSAARPVPTAKLAKPAKHVEPAKAATTAKPAEPAKAAKPKPSGNQKPAKGAKEAKADGKGKKPAPAKPEEEQSAGPMAERMLRRPRQAEMDFANGRTAGEDAASGQREGTHCRRPRAGAAGKGRRRAAGPAAPRRGRTPN